MQTETLITAGVQMPVQFTIEPWVTAEIVAAHLGFKPDHIRKLANKGLIPGSCSSTGRKCWRFKLSEVDAAYAKLNAAPDVTAKADKKAK